MEDSKYLIGTLHRDFDYEFDLFTTTDVVEEIFDEEQRSNIVTYRRRVTAPGWLILKMTNTFPTSKI